MCMKPFRILLLAPLFLISCGRTDEIRLTGVNDFSFKGFEEGTVTFAALVGVSNPSGIAFRITDMNLKTAVNGNYLGDLKTADKIRIPARSDSTYQMTFTLTINNMLANMASIYALSRQKQVQIDLKGEVMARTWIGKKKVEVSESRIVDVPANLK